MAVSMGVDVAVAGMGAMSNEASVSSSVSGTQNGERDMVQSKAQCLTSAIELIDESSLSEEFKKALADLPKKLDETKPEGVKAFFDFFDNFGTHFYKSCDFGGELVETKFVDKSSFSTESKTSASVKTSLEVNAGMAGGGASAGVSSENQESKSGDSSKSDTTTTARGGTPGAFSSSPDAALAWGPWAKSLTLNPVPVNPKLKPTYTLEKDEKQSQVIRSALFIYMRKRARKFSTTYQVFFEYAKDCHESGPKCSPPLPNSPSAALPSPKKAVALLETEEGTRLTLNRRRRAPNPPLSAKASSASEDITEKSKFPLLSIKGSLGKIADWALGALESDPVIRYGKITMVSQSVPSIGSIEEIKIKMEGPAGFTMFRIVDEANGNTYIFDARADKKKGNEWVLKPLPLFGDSATAAAKGSVEEKYYSRSKNRY
jgi:hypothetical protein